jgi:hypothetical protein
MDGRYSERLIREQFLAWHGIALDRARAEALAEILARVDWATADALRALTLDDQPGDRDRLVTLS